jgi:hypothetical protein
LAFLVVFGMAACTGPSGVPDAIASTAPASPATARVFTLLANNHLLVADITTGAVLAELTLAAPPPPVAQIRALAIAKETHTLYALVTEAAGRARVAAVDTTTLSLTTSIDPGGELVYHGLAIGPRSGRLYLFANRAGDAIVRVIDPTGARPPETWPARPSDGRNWVIYQGAIASDESALFLSYHGPDTTGIDRLEIQPTGLLRCRATPRAESGCFLTHGPFALTGGGLIASMAEQPVALLDPVTGERRGEYDMKLEGNHMLELTIAAGRMYAVGSCGYTGGLATADLATGQVRVLAESRGLGVVCGERIVALSDGSVLVVAKGRAPNPSPLPGSLVVLSSDGKPLRTIPTSAEAMDLLLF